MYPRNMICFWYVVVNILHSHDNKDDDDDDKVLELLTGTKKNCKN